MRVSVNSNCQKMNGTKLTGANNRGPAYCVVESGLLFTRLGF